MMSPTSVEPPVPGVWQSALVPARRRWSRKKSVGVACLEVLAIACLVDEAETCWRRALSLDPNHGLALLDVGRLALSRRRLDEAVSLLQRAAELSRRSIDPVYNLSRVYRLSGEIARA